MRPLVAMTCSGFCGYAALLAVAPLWAVHGGAGTGGAGLVNGVLLAFTVLTQLLVPAALRRFGWGPVLIAGMALLGAPSALYAVSDALAPVLAISAVRGVGFGVLTVTGSSAVAALVGAERRGDAIGIYGLAIALPNLLLLPAGPWVAQHVGFWVVFCVSAVPVLGIPAARRLAEALPGRPPEPARAATGAPVFATLVPLLRPTLLLLTVTMAGGAAITFVPQMVSGSLLGALGLLVMGLVAALSRWRAGRLADRYGTQRFLWPLAVLTATSAALVAWSVADPQATRAGVFLAAAAMLGLAYGALQNLTLVVAFAVVSRRHHNLASSVWNIGFDGGTALGAVAVGVIAQQTSFTTAFLVVAGLAVLVLPAAVVRGHRP
ncbi:MFS transporter [Nocardioides sp. LHG3406-4]|uniref:MFS transporter n=1 Tax=Nocardioides sp. LHG3406-4 TaxID=2804575 RepID=UPI003CF3DDEC